MERLDRPLTVVFLGSRDSHGECLVSALQSIDSRIRFRAHSSAVDWLALESDLSATLVVIGQEQCFSAEGSTLSSDLMMLMRRTENLRFAVLSHREDPCSAIEALQLGARGYILADLPLLIMLQALRLILAGSIFLPPASLILLLSQTTRPMIQMTFGQSASSAIDLLAAKTWSKAVKNDPGTDHIEDYDSSIRNHLARLLQKIRDRKNCCREIFSQRSPNNLEHFEPQLTLND